MKKGYIDLRGHKTWSVQWNKKGEPVLLLHGGLSSTEDWADCILPAIKKNKVFAYDRTAHGRTGSRPGYYHFDFQTGEAISYIEDVIKSPVHLIGWSDGGIISLLIALKRPDLVKSIVAIGTNFHWDSGLPFNEPSEANAPIVISPEDAAEFAERSPDPAYMQAEIIRKAFQVWASEPTMTTTDLARITCPVLVLTGDDEPFSNHHTIELYEALPNGRLAIIPAASHFVVKSHSKEVVRAIKKFYKNPEFPITKWPRLRKAQQERLLEHREN
jgi:pimeloyl-ACP methyl ester carboxylesterase